MLASAAPGFQIDPHYASLAAILRQAYDRAAIGKGKERHGVDLPFSQQPMQAISNFLGSPDGMAFQVLKKLHEAKNLPPEQARNEFLDCIVYLSGIILYHDARHPAPTPEVEPIPPIST